MLHKSVGRPLESDTEIQIIVNTIEIINMENIRFRNI